MISLGRRVPLRRRALHHHIGLLVHPSTSFANPAVTIARSLSDTSAGIAPAGIAAFIAAQLPGAAIAVMLSGWL
jgi:glycerol uptake facilitator-like aquaporin